MAEGVLRWVGIVSWPLVFSGDVVAVSFLGFFFFFLFFHGIIFFLYIYIGFIPAGNH